MALPAAEQAFAEAVRLYRAGRHDDAFLLTARAVELDPSHAEASLELGRLLVAARRDDEAEQVLRRGLAANAGHFGLSMNLAVLLSPTAPAGQGLASLRPAAPPHPPPPPPSLTLPP